MLRALGLIFLAILVIAFLPVWPYASGWRWGYYPSGAFFVLLVLVILFVAAGGRRTV